MVTKLDSQEYLMVKAVEADLHDTSILFRDGGAHCTSQFRLHVSPLTASYLPT